jgi:hypothetical protein
MLGSADLSKVNSHNLCKRTSRVLGLEDTHLSRLSSLVVYNLFRRIQQRLSNHSLSNQCRPVHKTQTHSGNQ